MKMKVIILVFMGFTLFLGCSDNSGDKNTVINIPSSTPAYLVRSSCMSCHETKGNTFGPSIEGIAVKHKNTNINELIAVVKFGRKKSELKWGTAPKPSSEFSEADIKKAIEWMMNKPE
ncbi:MAG: c-type cytochrome [Gammaproteobacteria bacterium]|nr:c-type cytochrome [Gammaproteobacteria bacterium]